MLTALELYGFKSFPDRTRFEFPQGITVVVGPNGSGKSNIVDGIKWVLGEQSAKSLRGKEMADVIFKGTSGQGGRKPANTAEATLFLDNSSRRLQLDADEIRLTRRVYRSGEGEYLINGEPCRLKDIRNLIRGTGVGTDAYSLIEQGKVDQMLQASPRERRIMFEEAAGISRFKAKKVEAERRLGRVEQNLVRLADIVEEVGNRYRKIRSQATKAARYQELTTRLQELRTDVGAKDWRDFSRRLEAIERDQAESAAASESGKQELDDLEQRSRELDVELSRWSSRILDFQNDINELIRQITQEQSGVALHQSRVDDLKVQTVTARESLARDTARSESLERRLAEARQTMETSGQECEATATRLADVTDEITELLSSIARHRDTAREKRDQQTALTGESSELGKTLSSADSRLQMSSTAAQRLQETVQQMDTDLSGLKQQLQDHHNTSRRLENEAAAKDSALAEARAALDATREKLEAARQGVDEKRRQQTGATQRAEVIQELENRLEGVDSGARDLIKRAREGAEAALQNVVGLVADIIRVNVQHAELVDLALGPCAQGLIVDGSQLIEEIVEGRIRPGGRVRLIQLAHPPTFGTRAGLDLHEHQGVVGRMDKLVQTEPEYQVFMEQMLGGTWLVKSLADALRLRDAADGRARFVTLAGELLEADGTLIAGPRAMAAGLVSRRSELRALHRDIHRLSAEIRDDSQQVDRLGKEVKSLDQQVQVLLGEHTEIAQQLSDQRATAKSVQSQMDGVLEQRRESMAEVQTLRAGIAELQEEIEDGRTRLQEQEQRLAEIETWLIENEQTTADQEASLTDLQQHQTSAKVQLAKSRQQRTEAENNCQNLDSQRDECCQTVRANRDGLARMLWQQRDSRREISAATTRLRESEANRQDLDRQLQELTRQRNEVDGERRNLSETINSGRDKLQKLTAHLHEIELQQRQLSMEREQLATRLQDDYEIDVSQLEIESGQPDQDREAIDNEISGLRKSIANIGSVNMDALAELEEMQQRFESLDAQYQDLVQSREALEKIIQKINNDSRRLFSETLEAIRSNFQVLFRQTFGGGRADLVLEEDVDILEAGIDIVATPPGKPEFNNSLLSGGERALTAVSLLMAIFQFRPSPFCVLDEVDAPFDEANIGRFIDVLTSFLGWTKFIIVTHSKRTMTAATTLYGVTMQESGVSKKVSVRFEDVNEEGEISDEAVDRDDDEQRTVA